MFSSKNFLWWQTGAHRPYFCSSFFIPTLTINLKACSHLFSLNSHANVCVWARVQIKSCALKNASVHVFLQKCSLWISQKQQQGKWGVKVSGLLRINRSSLINHPSAMCVCGDVCSSISNGPSKNVCSALVVFQLMHMFRASLQMHTSTHARGSAGLPQATSEQQIKHLCVFSRMRSKILFFRIH